MRASAAVVAGAVAACLLTAPSASSAPAAVPCDVFDLSPNFAADGTIMCVARLKPRPQDPVTGVEVHVSTDKGRSWKKKKATGLLFDTSSSWTQVVFSARYAQDRTIFVQEASNGLYQTTDGGETFTFVDRLASGPNSGLRNLTPFVAAPLDGVPVPVGQEQAGALAHGYRPLSAVLAPPLRRPVAGSASGHVARFLIPSRFPAEAASAVVSVPATGVTPWRHEVALCTPQLACTDTRLVMPPYMRPIDAVTVDRTTLVIGHAVIGEFAFKSFAWRSVDGGRTYARLANLERLLNKYRSYSAGVAPGPRRTLWLKVDHSGLSSKDPKTQLFKSTDGGVTWSRAAYEKRAASVLSINEMPPSGSVSGGPTSAIRVAPDGRMFVLGGSPPYGRATIYCSTSLRVWRPTC